MDPLLVLVGFLPAAVCALVFRRISRTTAG